MGKVGRIPVFPGLPGTPADGQIVVADSANGNRWKYAYRSRILLEDHTDAGPSNTTTETDLFNLTLPTTLAAGDLLRVRAYGEELNNSGSSANFTKTFYLGSTSIASGAVSNATTANVRRWMFQAEIDIVATNDQRIGMSYIQAASGSNAFVIAAGNVGVGYGTAAEDLTAAKVLKLTGTLGTAASTITMTRHFVVVEVVKR